MFEEEFKEIYEAISQIYEMSEYSGWHEIANDITIKVQKLEKEVKEEIDSLEEINLSGYDD